MEARSHRSSFVLAHAVFASTLTVTAACTSKSDTDTVASAIETIWEDDNFDNLALGALDGQNDWASAPERGSAEVVSLVENNRILRIAADGAGDESVILMGKAVAPQTGGRHVFEFDVRVDNPNLPSLAKIEIDTFPRAGEDGKWANKKFEIHFGSSIRITYGAVPIAQTLVDVTTAGIWYHLRADIDLTQELVSMRVNDDLRASALPMGTGPLVGLSLSGWDRTDEAPGPLGPVHLDNLRGAQQEAPRGIWCVQVRVRETGPPCSNPTPFATVQEAVDRASAGDEVRIANDTWRATGAAAAVAVLDKSIVLSGGYSGGRTGWSTPNSGPSATRLDGQDLRDAVQVVGTTAIALRNLIVTGGGVRTPDGEVDIDGDPVEFRNGGPSEGRFRVSGTLVVRGDHIFGDGTTIQGPGRTQIISGTLTSLGTMEIEQLEMQAGTLAGPGTVRVTRAFDVVPSSMINLRDVTVVNLGTATWAGGRIQTFDSNGADGLPGVTLDNRGLFDIRGGDSIFHFGAGSSWFQNSGVVRKSTTAATRLLIGFSGGQVELEGGTLSLEGDNTTTGSMNAIVAAGASLVLTTGINRTYAGTLTGSGAGSIVWSSDLWVAPAGLTLDLPGGLLQWRSGRLLSQGGELVNAGQLNLTTTLTKQIVGVTVRNQGTVLWTGGPIRISNPSGAGGLPGVTFDNSGLFDIRVDDTFFHGGDGSSWFQNSGVVRKSTATGTTSLTLGFSGGQVELESGILRLNGADTTTGSMNAVVAAGATLDLTAGNNHAYAGTLTGSGAGTVLWASDLWVAPTGLTLDLPGDLLQWRSGRVLSQGGELVNIGQLNLTSTFTKQIRGVTVRNQGTILWTGGQILTFDANDADSLPGTTLDNTGVFDIRVDDSLFHFGSGSSWFQNSGVVRKSTTAETSSLTLGFSGGQVELESGTLRLNGANTTTGSMNAVVAAGATLDLATGNNHAYAGTLTGWGAGTILWGGDLWVAPAGLTLNLPGGLLQWRSGRLLSQGGELVNAGQLNVASTSTKRIVGLTVRNQGSILWTGGQILTFDGSSLDIQVGGLLEIAGDNTLSHLGVGSTSLTNSGTIRRRSTTTGTATLELGQPIINDGTISIEQGLLLINGAYTQSAIGRLEITLLGATPSTGILRVRDRATLSGALEVDVAGFTPTPEQPFRLLTYGDRAGTRFDTIDCHERNCVPTYGSTELTLTFP